MPVVLTRLPPMRMAFEAYRYAVLCLPIVRRTWPKERDADWEVAANPYPVPAILGFGYAESMV